MMLIKS